uniref:uncharacterized protein n=1 Tax=Myxine glutinosa TaxID=7769 RepID=UPI00358ED761
MENRIVHVNIGDGTQIPISTAFIKPSLQPTILTVLVPGQSSPISLLVMSSDSLREEEIVGDQDVEMTAVPVVDMDEASVVDVATAVDAEMTVATVAQIAVVTDADTSIIDADMSTTTDADMSTTTDADMSAVDMPPTCDAEMPLTTDVSFFLKAEANNLLETGDANTSAAASGTPEAAASGTSEAAASGTSEAAASGTSEAAASGTSEAAASGTSEAAASGTSEAAASGTSEAAASGTSEAAASGTSEAAASGTSEAAASGTSEAAASGTSEAAASGTSEAAASGTPEAAASGASEAAASGTPEAAESGTPEAAESGTPEAAESGTPEADASRTPEADTSRTPEADASRTPEADASGTSEAAASSTSEDAASDLDKATALDVDTTLSPDSNADLSSLSLRRYRCNVDGCSGVCKTQDGLQRHIQRMHGLPIASTTNTAAVYMQMASSRQSDNVEGSHSSTADNLPTVPEDICGFLLKSDTEALAICKCSRLGEQYACMISGCSSVLYSPQNIYQHYHLVHKMTMEQIDVNYSHLVIGHDLAQSQENSAMVIASDVERNQDVSDPDCLASSVDAALTLPESPDGSIEPTSICPAVLGLSRKDEQNAMSSETNNLSLLEMSNDPEVSQQVLSRRFMESFVKYLQRSRRPCLSPTGTRQHQCIQEKPTPVVRKRFERPPKKLKTSAVPQEDGMVTNECAMESCSSNLQPTLRKQQPNCNKEGLLSLKPVVMLDRVMQDPE